MAMNGLGRVCVGLFAAAALSVQAAPVVLLNDNFDANTPNTTDLNVDLARQTGILAPLSYTMALGPGNYGHQLQNVNAVNQLLVADFAQSTVSLNHNFNGAYAAGGLRISFDVEPNPPVYASADQTLWGCINLGASQANQLVNVNGDAEHFGVLFRQNGNIQVFDGSAVVTEVPYAQAPVGVVHIDIEITGDDGNGLDGVGDTVISIYVNGAAPAAYTFTKTGGYANNYINLQGAYRAHFDNLVITQIDPPGTAPEFNAQPRSRAVSEGQPVTLSASVLGTPTPDFRWYKDGVEVPGAIGNTFSIAATTATDAGAYRLVASNILGRATSSVATVTVGLAMVNPSFEADTFTQFPGYVEQNGPITGWTSLPNHGVNPGTTFSPFANNGTIPDGQKVAFMQGDGALSQLVSGFTIGAEYRVIYFENARSGGVPAIEVKVGDITVVPAHSRSPGGYVEMISDVFVADAAEMQISFIKSNPNGGDTTALIDSVAIVEVPPDTIPTITQQPTGASIATGGDITFTTRGSGSLPLTYQWYKDGTALTGSTQPTLSFVGISGAAEGDYTVIISNSGGSVTSVVARLIVTEPITTLFNTGVDSTGAALADGSIDSHYTLIVNADSASTDAIVEDSTVFPIVSGPWVANNASGKWIGPRFNTSEAAGLATAGGRYVYQTSFDLTGRDPSTTVIVGGWAVDNNGVSISVNGTPTGIQNNNGFAGLTTFTLNSGNATFVQGINTIDFEVVNADATAGYTGLRVVYTSTDAQVLPGTPPTIQVHPGNRTVVEGETVTFSVGASGSDPLSYQWSRNGEVLNNQTNRTLSLTNVTTADNGAYRVMVSNSAGNATSNPGILEVKWRRISGVYSTGVDDTGALAADGATDIHWIVGSSADPVDQGPDAFVINPAMSPVPPWLAAGPNSKWLAPRPDQNTGNAEGNYTYQTFFELTAEQVPTFRLTGQLAVDNSLIDILVNGVSQGVSGGGFTSWLPFTLTTGFLEGPNTVDFIINNAPATPNPTAFRADLIGLVEITPKPRLTVTQSGPGTLTISWIGPSGFVLESAPTVNGPWTEIEGAPNPLTVDTSEGAAKFFRMRQ